MFVNTVFFFSFFFFIFWSFHILSVCLSLSVVCNTFTVSKSEMLAKKKSNILGQKRRKTNSNAYVSCFPLRLAICDFILNFYFSSIGCEISRFFAFTSDIVCDSHVIPILVVIRFCLLQAITRQIKIIREDETQVKHTKSFHKWKWELTKQNKIRKK